MIKVKVEKSGPCRKTVTIEVPAEAVATEYAAVVQESVKVAVVPGYRKGHAPQPLVERHFARELAEDVKDRLISRSYRDALRQERLDPVAVLDLTDVAFERDQPLSFKVVLDVPPEFKLPKYKGLALKAGAAIEVTDAQVQDSLDRLREQRAVYLPVEGRPIRRQDLAQVDYTGSVDGQPLRDLVKGVPEAQSLADQRHFLAVADEGGLIPGLGLALVGMASGEEKELPVEFPADFRVPALAGKKARYRVKVKAIREKHVPAVDAEFLKALGVESEDALRARLRAVLSAEAGQKETRRLKDEIVAQLLHKTSIDVPETLVQEESRHMFSSLVRQNLMRGVTAEQIAGQREQLAAQVIKSAGERVRIGYILHRIAEEEQVVVSDEDLEQHVREMAVLYRMAPDTLRHELEEKKELDAIRHELRMNRTLDRILEQAKVGEEGFLGRLFGGGGTKDKA